MKRLTMSKKIKNKIWKDIPGYEGLYQVNNLGEVKSLKRYVNHSVVGLKRVVNEKIKKPVMADRYLQIKLHRDGVGKHFLLHRIVANAFVPNPNGKQQVNHKDGNKLNNKYTNLEWCTSFENMLHAVDTGLMKKRYGENSRNHKLTENDVIKIRQLWKDNKTIKYIADLFDMSTSHIGAIIKYKYWSHI